MQKEGGKPNTLYHTFNYLANQDVLNPQKSVVQAANYC